MEAPADTWCGSLLSSDEADVEQPSAQDSGRLPFAPSLRPTFGRNTSLSTTESAMSTDIQHALASQSSLFTSDVIGTSDFFPFNSESSALDVDPATAQSSFGTSTLPDGLSTVVASTTDIETTSTSTDIIEPPGRAVIFLIQTADNERRAIRRRANSGFIGIDNPELFAGGVPIYYSGEDYKELSAQGRPPGGSITSGFTDSGETLAFRNEELPNGEAGFCQDADGQVHITFTIGPSGCVPVNLAVYGVQQCQDGRITGRDKLTSSLSGTIVSQATNIEGTATTEESLSAQSSSEVPSVSTDLVPSESIHSASQTAELEAFSTHSAYAAESFVSLDSTATALSASEVSTQEPGDTTSPGESFPTEREDLETLSSVSSVSGDSASQPATASTSQISTETSDLQEPTVAFSNDTGFSRTSGVGSQATTEIEESDTETTIKISGLDTTVAPETTEATTTEGDTSTTDVISDADTTEITDTTDTILTIDTTTTEGDTFTVISDADTIVTTDTTTNAGGLPATEAINDDGTTDTTTTNIDTIETFISDTTLPETIDTTTTNDDTTTDLEAPTTTEVETTTAETTTTAEPTTTTEAAPEPEPQFACGDAGFTSPYTYMDVTFDLFCERSYSYLPLDILNVESFGDCLRKCAQNAACNGIVYRRVSRLCILTTETNVFGPDNRFDLAKVVMRGSN
ncbi:hypothetical protein FSARC_14760 [Fusarium sarcochroum]|uniref:Apple domain-containing protein n=1 Tax=Fusarium sarcochroum TaxID=1208366 RepID=A0A8H4SR08_9HYPO|nr:hypothetical protein FSARC_14760 [Fusarium sarcochroum]